MSIKLNDKFLRGFVAESEINYMQPFADNAYELLTSGKGPGNDFLGWVDLPNNYDKEEFARIKIAAEKIKKTDINTITPIEAMNLLFELKKLLSD